MIDFVSSKCEFYKYIVGASSKKDLFDANLYVEAIIKMEDSKEVVILHKDLTVG